MHVNLQAPAGKLLLTRQSDSACVCVCAQHARQVVLCSPIAVVGGRPNGHQLLIEHELVPFHNKLMRSGDKIHFIRLTEMGANVASKQISSPSGTQTPPLNFLRVTPQQVTHGTIMRYFLLPVNCADLQGMQMQSHLCTPIQHCQYDSQIYSSGVQ